MKHKVLECADDTGNGNPRAIFLCNETIVMMGSGILVIRTTLKISLKTPLIKVLKIGHNGTATKAHLFPCHCTNRICS